MSCGSRISNAHADVRKRRMSVGDIGRIYYCVCMSICSTRVNSADWIYSNFALHLIINSHFDVLANPWLAKIHCVLLKMCFIFLYEYCLKHFLLWWEFSMLHMINAGGICKNSSKCHKWCQILTCTGVCQQILAKLSSVKFHGNKFRNSWICICRCMNSKPTHLMDMYSSFAQKALIMPTRCTRELSSIADLEQGVLKLKCMLKELAIGVMNFGIMEN